MAQRTHIFIASAPTSRGELTLALRIAQELHDQGDKIVFVAWNVESRLFANKPYMFVPIDGLVLKLKEALASLIRDYTADSLILVDILTNTYYFNEINFDLSFFQNISIPVIALDVYGIEHTDFGDIGFHQMDIRSLRGIPSLRLLPVPFHPLDASGAYCAVPRPISIEDSTKRMVRSELHLNETNKMIVIVGAAWQLPSFWHNPDIRRCSFMVPRLITYYLDILGPEVHVVHIGPEPYAVKKSFTSRYHWLQQVDEKRFHAMLAAADLFVTPNIVGTTLSTAMVIGVPMLVAINSFRANSFDEVASNFQGGFSEFVQNWLHSTLPIYPFRIWPTGGFRLFTSLLKDNPFCKTFRQVEILDEKGFLEGCHLLIEDASARQNLLNAQKKYVDVVRTLPNPATLIHRLFE